MISKYNNPLFFLNGFLRDKGLAIMLPTDKHVKNRKLNLRLITNHFNPIGGVRDDTDPPVENNF